MADGGLTRIGRRWRACLHLLVVYKFPRLSGAVTGAGRLWTLQGKRALVTGAARGIGRAIAIALAREGTELFLVGIDGAGLEASAREAEVLGVKVQFEIRDLAKPAEVSASVAACLAAFDGGLDILVNSAGVLRYGIHNELRTETWNQSGHHFGARR